MTKQTKEPTVSNPVEAVVIHILGDDESSWTDRPVHDDIDKYGYELHQSDEYKRWYASYESQKGTVWFMWCRDHFRQIERRHVPDDV